MASEMNLLREYCIVKWYTLYMVHITLLDHIGRDMWRSFINKVLQKLSSNHVVRCLVATG